MKFLQDRHVLVILCYCSCFFLYCLAFHFMLTLITSFRVQQQTTIFVHSLVVLKTLQYLVFAFPSVISLAAQENRDYMMGFSVNIFIFLLLQSWKPQPPPPPLFDEYDEDDWLNWAWAIENILHYWVLLLADPCDLTTSMTTFSLKQLFKKKAFFGQFRRRKSVLAIDSNWLAAT